jgi:putative ABC transport system substrate-binding protein
MAIKIGRREFITLLGGGEVAWPCIVRAQQATGRMPHIAFLSLQSPTTLEPRHIEQFKVGLVENGLVEGQNITVDYFWGEGSTERLLQLATELAQRNLDVIVTSGPQPLRALLATKTKTPIVFAILSDPIGDGFVQSLARPGGNITGLSMSGTDLESKRLEVLKNAVPTIDKVSIAAPQVTWPRFLVAESLTTSRSNNRSNSSWPSICKPLRPSV